jgi:lipopolysaccharide/colanic/teichoic acid biosynthesis glycosyltransferase
MSTHAHVPPAGSRQWNETAEALGYDWSSVERETDSAVYTIAKRTLDVVVAGVLLIVLAPLLLVVAILIRLESPGPALFLQTRTGTRRRGGHRGAWEVGSFTLMKFRSMRSDADPAIHEAHIRDYVAGKIAAEENEGRAPFKLRDDPRVTGVGRFLRRTSIDELPQLINVLRGEMSLVGPRPVPLYEASLCKGEQRLRFAALPGLTGLWQVRGRCALPWTEMVRMDCEYVQRRSLLLDLMILALTIPAVLSGKGAS